MLILIGLLLGAGLSLISSLEPQLASLTMLISVIFPTDIQIGFILGCVIINSITQYFNIIVGDTQLTSKTVTNKKSLTEKGKGLSVAMSAIQNHILFQSITLAAGLFTWIILPAKVLSLVGSILLPLSLVIMGVGWLIYCFKNNNKTVAAKPLAVYCVAKLSIIIALAIVALITLRTQSGGTLILFTCLFSISSVINNLDKKQELIAVQNKEVKINYSKLPLGASIVNGILSSVLIGHAGSATDKIISGRVAQTKGKKHNSDNEVNSEIINAISNGIKTGLGIVLFLIAGSSRDQSTTLLATILRNVTISPLLGMSIIVLMVLLTALVYPFAKSMVKNYIKYHNWKTNNNIWSLTNKLNVVVCLSFVFITGSGVPILVGIIGACLGLQYAVKALGVEQEIITSVVSLLPGFSLLGLL